jgi:hypothetical protein
VVTDPLLRAPRRAAALCLLAASLVSPILTRAHDRLRRQGVNITTLDFGGRYKLHRGFNLLFMAGRSMRSNFPGQVEFMGYLGIQILLSDYGRRLSEE